MNHIQMMLAHRNGADKRYFEFEVERRLREKYSEADEKNILRGMLTDGESVAKYLYDLSSIREAVCIEMESKAGENLGVYKPNDGKSGIMHRVSSVENSNAIAFVTMAEKGYIDDITASEHATLFSEWVDGIAYGVGAIRHYDGKLYRCVQAHTSQSDWNPISAPSLWAVVGDPTVEYPEWSQPVGAHDAYAMGDKVTYGGEKWVSSVDGNVWTPGSYGWNKVVE